MIRVVSLSFITLFVFLFAFTAYSYPGKHHGRHGKGDWWNKAEVQEKLNLTDGQRSRIEEIASSREERLESLHTRLETSHEGLKEEMKNPDSTRDEILAEYNRLESVHTEFRRAKIEVMLDIRDVLSSEQMVMLADIKERHKENCGKGK